MQDLINNVDSRIEHKFHNVLQDGCSMCYTEATKCKDCKGYGEVTTMESVYGGADSHIQAPVGSETCENCSGSGVEPDEDIIKERLAGV